MHLVFQPSLSCFLTILPASPAPLYTIYFLEGLELSYWEDAPASLYWPSAYSS